MSGNWLPQKTEEACVFDLKGKEGGDRYLRARRWGHQKHFTNDDRRFAKFGLLKVEYMFSRCSVGTVILGYRIML